jgi:uncharacterized oxidoreductase
MGYVVLDVADAESIRTGAPSVLSRFPALNCVINNAGIQMVHDFSRPGGWDEAGMAAEIETNVLGLMRVCAAFIPHLSRQPDATLINISSGLAFVPLARAPVYCATKAATHSFCVSLRHQLRHTGVRVIELIPPWVDTNLDKGRPRPADRSPMPLPQFISQAMEGLAGDADEVAVGDARFLYGSAGTSETFAKTFARLNP